MAMDVSRMRFFMSDESSDRYSHSGNQLTEPQWPQGVPLEIHNDAAGNTWFTLRGESDQALLIGGHMDSVPNGGWLDGCLNVLAGVEGLRRIAAGGAPPVTGALVHGADRGGGPPRWTRSPPLSESSSARAGSSGTGSPGAARPRTRARLRWTSDATRSQ